MLTHLERKNLEGQMYLAALIQAVKPLLHQNPYSVPELCEALKFLARCRGIKNYYDVDCIAVAFQAKKELKKMNPVYGLPMSVFPIRAERAEKELVQQ